MGRADAGNIELKTSFILKHLADYNCERSSIINLLKHTTLMNQTPGMLNDSVELRKGPGSYKANPFR